MEKKLDRTSEVYAGTYSSPAFQEHHRKRIHWMCSQVRGRRVLDVGCSQGIVSILLAREGFHVTGIDLHPEAIEHARQALSTEPPAVQESAGFAVGDALDPDLQMEPFDTILAGEILEHLTQPERLVERSWHLLREDGRLIVTVPFGIHPHVDHKRTYYIADVIETLSPYFTVSTLNLIHVSAGADSPVPVVGIVADRLSQPSPPDRTQAAEWLAFSQQAFSAAEARYLSQLARLDTRARNLQRRIEADLKQASDRQRELEQERDAERARFQIDLKEAADRQRQLEQERDAERARFQIDLKAAADRQRQLEQRERDLREAARERDRLIRQLRRRLGMMEQATSYQLGLLIVRALKRPYLLLLLPFRAAALLFRAVLHNRRSRGRKWETVLADLPFEPRPLPEPPEAGRASDDTPGSTVGARHTAGPAKNEGPVTGVGARELDETTRLLLSGMYEDPRAVSDLIVGAILDEFSLACFQPECRVATFRPDNWRPILERERPHFVLVESAWKGNGGSWEYRVAQYNYPGREELERLVHWCRQRGLPTVFWNKEDPIHFERFIEAARVFDYVFTSDANCLPKYRKELGHNRVYALPFAAQPLIHNPIRVPGYREKSVCFAGSYYGNRHPKRREELEWLLDAALSFGLDIYDRAHGQQGQGAEHFRFPERFKAAIAGGLPYNEIVRAYKQYKVFLNVNSVTDSPTMFSRRVFELLACGTPVVSTPARGIGELLGSDVVRLVGSQEEAQAAIKQLLVDQELWGRRSLGGQRAVAEAHTYAHRLQAVANSVGYNVGEPAPPSLTALTWAPAPGDELRDLLQQVADQKAPPTQILVICGADARQEAEELLSRALPGQRSQVMSVGNPADGTTWWKDALAECAGDYVALLAPGDYYGPHYLMDLLRAVSYSNADVVGKASFALAEAPGGEPRIMNPGREYSYVDSVVPAAMMARHQVPREMGWPGERLHDPSALEALSRAGVRVFADNRFNYVKGGLRGTYESLDI